MMYKDSTLVYVVMAVLLVAWVVMIVLSVRRAQRLSKNGPFRGKTNCIL